MEYEREVLICNFLRKISLTHDIPLQELINHPDIVGSIKVLSEDLIIQVYRFCNYEEAKLKCEEYTGRSKLQVSLDLKEDLMEAIRNKFK